jgi:GT2 family glycosyltransferase/glycosyltransferase involved in cell wall biosynthesis
MLTRLLNVCGLELGPESELMPAQSDNPDGFWEHLRFVALNDEVLNALGGAWDLPPRSDEDFSAARLDPLRMKAKMLIENFDSASAWGWKDPRNSLTLPFWKSILPELKTLVIVRNPLEVAYSMRERNGTSYSFGLRLWEIYNRRLFEATTDEERLVTHYDFFFENPETELGRIANFLALPCSDVNRAAALVATDRRHTHFTMEQLIDARVSAEVVDLYRTLMAEADRGVRAGLASTDSSASKGNKAKGRVAPQDPKSGQSDLLPGAISRLNTAVPAGEMVRRVEAAHRTEIENLHREIQKLTIHLAHRDGRIGEMEKRRQELERVREHFVQTNQLLHARSISLAESEVRGDELRNALRQQLQATKKLSRLLDDLDDASARLRSSRRWQIANPIAALKDKFSPGRGALGYGHLEKIVSAYRKWLTAHPEMAVIDDQIRRLASGAVPAATSKVAPINKSPAGDYVPPVPTKPIEFPLQEQVEISIIIPVFNQFQFTQACLASLQEHQDAERFEVIVVDDYSTDVTEEVIRKIPGVVYIRNETNSGFISSCNRGAEQARGSYLLFLNNDTMVTPGWLAALRETFENEPKAGFVGSKLIFPDGRLQEAGGIIWRDGSGWNRGKFDDPEKPEYNFLREVDYCSAACVMIPKALFERVGGFDSKYAPGYYEDTDLAFKVRRHGFKVLYQPLSEVIHYEGATGGIDLSAGAKRYQEINRATFAENWADVLVEKPLSGDAGSNETPNPGQKRILVIDHHLPMADRDAGSVRMFHILNILHSLGHRVTFLPDNLTDSAPYSDELRKRGIEVYHHPYCKSVRDYLEKHGFGFDTVILSRCDFARKHIANVRLYAPQSRIIFDTVDLHFLRMNREADLTQDAALRVRAEQMKRQEHELIDEADETWVVSGFEQELLRKERPDKSVEIVPTIVDVPGSNTPFSLRHDFLFIGGFQHTPNIDAVIFFTNEIYPLVEARLPGVKFYVIGNKAPPAVIALASENIIITGLQPDVRPYFDSVRLSIAPLRFGAGVKGKINQSMGLGVPVVATSIAVEGMGLTNDEDVLIADTPESFARALIALHESEQLWDRLSKNGIEKTKAMYSCEVAREQLSRLFSNSHRNKSITLPRSAD